MTAYLEAASELGLGESAEWRIETFGLGSKAFDSTARHCHTCPLSKLSQRWRPLPSTGHFSNAYHVPFT